MQETQVRFPGQEDPLEKDMATHSSYSCLENPMDRGACQATVHGVARVGHDLVTKPPPREPVGVSDAVLFTTCIQSGPPGKSWENTNGSEQLLWNVVKLSRKILGYSSVSAVKSLPARLCNAMQKAWVQSLGQEDPLEEETATHASTLAGKSHG